MRKTLFLVIFILLLGGCILKKPTSIEPIELKDLTLSETDNGVSFNVLYNFEALKINKEYVINYGVVIVNHEVSNIDDINLDTKDNLLESSEINNNLVSFSIQNINEENYETIYSIRAYIKYLNSDGKENVIYDDAFNTFSLYNLAKSSNSDFAREIVFKVEHEVVSVVEITIIDEELSWDDTSYQVTLKKEGNVILINIQANDCYYFENIVLIINGIEIEEDNYTYNREEINYSYNAPDPLDYVTVAVTFDLDGGMWTEEFLKQINPDNLLTVTSLNDTSGNTYTLLDKTAVAFRTFNKLFIKHDANINAYKIVAVDKGTNSIINLDLPDYDYVLAVNSNCQDQAAKEVIEGYVDNDDIIGAYVLFSFDPNEYALGEIDTSFYLESAMTNNYTINLFDAVTLPIPYRKQFDFIGWTDGTNIYTTFPRYQVKDKVMSVNYKAVWEAYSFEEFENYMNSILPDTLTQSLTLPTTFSNYEITWSSRHPDILSNTGVYKKPYQNTTVILVATLKDNNHQEQISFELQANGYKELKTGIASSYIYRNYHLVTDDFFDILDIINCAFITAGSDGSLSGSTFLANVKSYIIPKAHEKGDWVVMSIAPESKWSAIAANPQTVKTFANNIVKMINQYGFDGVDIDWETPTNAEKTLFTAMMKEIYTKVKANNPNHIVSAAIAGGMWQPPRYDLANSQQYIDYINMMTYGMVSNGGYYQNALYRSTTANHPSGVGKTLNSCSIEESIAFYKQEFNIPYHKIIVGVAFYGIKQTFSNGSWSSGGSVYYTSIYNNYLNNSNYAAYFDENSGVPYILRNDGKEFISYDDPRSIKLKSQYVLDNKLGGIMYWENGCDTTGELLKAMKEGLKK